MIDTNVRAVKPSESGWSLSVDRDLCGHCGKQSTCESLGSLNSWREQHGQTIRLKECGGYSYPILFVDPTGTDGEFNTIRLGEAWAGRLSPGVEVTLIDKPGNVLGTAVVERVHTGDKEEVIREHAYQNHLYVESGMGQEEAGADLLRRLPSIYGNLIMKSNTRATVIYLKNKDLLK